MAGEPTAAKTEVFHGQISFLPFLIAFKAVK
jgi:hypothetical protein